jgi:hypothetical protein
MGSPDAEKPTFPWAGLLLSLLLALAIVGVLRLIIGFVIAFATLALVVVAVVAIGAVVLNAKGDR